MRPKRSSGTAIAPRRRPHSAEAHRIATDLGARPLIDGGRGASPPGLDSTCRRSGRAAAAPAAASADDDPFGLTRRERDVLPLLVKGRTNRQIAEELFISENTAGVHVSNILGKLGASTRTEAAGIAARLGVGAESGEVAPLDRR